MPVLFVGPRLIGFEAQILTELHYFDATLVQGKCKILVLEGVIETDFSGIFQVAGKVYRIDPGPVNGAHAHGTGCTTDEDFMPHEHSGALRDGVG